MQMLVDTLRQSSTARVQGADQACRFSQRSGRDAPQGLNLDGHLLRSPACLVRNTRHKGLNLTNAAPKVFFNGTKATARICNDLAQKVVGFLNALENAAQLTLQAVMSRNERRNRAPRAFVGGGS